MKRIITIITALSIIAIIACSNQKNKENSLSQKEASETANRISHPNKTSNNETSLNDEFKKYWYAGEAEITSYELKQARYGEIRDGNAVLIYVTEDFLPDIQVKADQRKSTNVPVLKLNATKNFNTGIYPYSIMQSTFYPVKDDSHAIKISSSLQEWCGHVYTQINNRDNYEVTSHSYFQGEADQSFALDKTILENELWTKIRINPKNLPQGALQIIPSLEFTRLRHKPIKAYEAKASLITEGKLQIYTIEYPELQRKLEISFTSDFPYSIEGWKETYISGFGQSAKELTTTATKLQQIKSPYWTKNSNKDEKLREELQLK